jgi:hypothetical protein
MKSSAAALFLDPFESNTGPDTIAEGIISRQDDHCRILNLRPRDLDEAEARAWRALLANLFVFRVGSTCESDSRYLANRPITLRNAAGEAIQCSLTRYARVNFPTPINCARPLAQPDHGKNQVRIQRLGVSRSLPTKRRG